MNYSKNYYQENLYPLQDGVLKIVKDFNPKFYLSGGTALSRFYTGHRFSDDLDFFVNGLNNFESITGNLLLSLENELVNNQIEVIRQGIITSKNFLRIIVRKGETELKLDFVNDVSIRFGNLVSHPEFGLIDNIENILSNKISAIYRLEVKDFVDIRAICRILDFEWSVAISQAKEKEPSVDGADISHLFRTFPVNLLDKIIWSETEFESRIIEDFGKIASDIAVGAKNSLSVQ